MKIRVRDRRERLGVPELVSLLRTAIAHLHLGLSHTQYEQLATHFALLLRWNKKINLTSVREPEEIAERHFAESLFLATLLEPAPGDLFVDVGSGAGFPGLPLKMAWPSVETILLEPNQKKTAFLSEVVRKAGLKAVDVRAERLDDATTIGLAGGAALVTMRAVHPSPELLAHLQQVTKPAGRVALYLGEIDAEEVGRSPNFQWENPVPVPNSERRVILIGKK